MTEVVAIIDYGSGNLRSVQKALERASTEAGSRADISITSQADAVAAADRVVLPGVGAFQACFQGLSALPGMLDALDEIALQRARPFLGVCVGMQLLARWGHEHGGGRGLGWIGGEVRHLSELFDTETVELRIPHMGWSDVDFRASADDDLWPTEGTSSAFYFADCFYFDVVTDTEVAAGSNYGRLFRVAVRKG
ncbi:MAG: imidazole glycerol phosphate synthase subunit HisH, partial [Pseudomonadota bacterium]